MRQKLTRSQLELKRFYEQYKKDFGTYPLQKEASLHFDVRQSSISKQINQIRAKGYLKDTPTKKHTDKVKTLIDYSLRFVVNQTLYIQLFKKQAKEFNYSFTEFLRTKGFPKSFVEESLNFRMIHILERMARFEDASLLDKLLMFLHIR